MTVGALLLGGMAVVGVTVYLAMLEMGNRYQETILQSRGLDDMDQVQQALLRLERDVALFADLSLSVEIASSFVEGKVLRAGTTGEKFDSLEELFQAAVLSQPYLDQLRLIGMDEGATEILRVQRTKDDVFVVPQEDLQRKAHRPYIQEAIKSGPDTIYYSEVSLNQENGEIEIPHRPVLRIGKQVLSQSGEPVGLLIINVNFRQFVEKLLAEDLQRYDLFLVNQEGYYLYHTDRERTFAWELGNEHRLQNDFEETRAFFDGTVEPADQWTKVSDGSDAFVYLHFLGDGIRHGDIVLAYRSQLGISGGDLAVIAYSVLVVVLLILGLAVALTRYLSRNVTLPLAEIASATRRLGEGRSQGQLPTHRNDEIGELARRFEKMRTRVEEHERLLRETNEDWDYFAHVTSHELREPLNRMAGMAQLVLLETMSPSSEGELQKIVEGLQKECELAMGQLSDFRTVLKHGESEMILKKVDLEVLIQKLLDELSEAFEERGDVRVHVNALPTVEAYPELLLILYRKLVENALRLQGEEVVQLSFTATRSDGDWILGVRHCSGLNPSGKLGLSVFTNVEGDDSCAAEKEVQLSICRKVVQRHQGKIWVESESGYTHFKFRIRSENNEYN